MPNDAREARQTDCHLLGLVAEHVPNCHQSVIPEYQEVTLYIFPADMFARGVRNSGCHFQAVLEVALELFEFKTGDTNKLRYEGKECSVDKDIKPHD